MVVSNSTCAVFDESVFLIHLCSGPFFDSRTFSVSLLLQLLRGWREVEKKRKSSCVVLFKSSSSSFGTESHAGEREAAVAEDAQEDGRVWGECEQLPEGGGADCELPVGQQRQTAQLYPGVKHHTQVDAAAQQQGTCNATTICSLCYSETGPPIMY